MERTGVKIMNQNLGESGRRQLEHTRENLEKLSNALAELSMKDLEFASKLEDGEKQRRLGSSDAYLSVSVFIEKEVDRIEKVLE